jgi:hypothetical protein
VDIVLWFIWPAFIGIGFLQAAITGRFRLRRGMSPDATTPIPNWARLVCLLLSGVFGALSLYIFLRHFNFQL